MVLTNALAAPSPTTETIPAPTNAPVTRPPTEPPGPSPPPSAPGPAIRQLTPYGLLYSVTENRIPFRSEYLEAVEVTRMYLEGFFKEQLDDGDATQLDELLTVFVDSSFDFGQPLLIDYDSSAVFTSSSTIIPSIDTLDRTLTMALEGENLNGFLGMLQSLPPQNIFSTTIYVNKTESGAGVRMATPPSKKTESVNAPAATGAVAAAAGLVMVAATFVLYKRRRADLQEGGDFIAKMMDETETVDGETHCGGSWSSRPPTMGSLDERHAAEGGENLQERFETHGTGSWYIDQ